MDRMQPRFRPKLKLQGALDEILRTLIFVVVVTVLFDMAIPRSLVDGRSMQPTFQDSERLIVSRLHLLLFEPERGDVIVFNSVDTNDPDVMLIKRVIGLPGETVSFINEQVYINGVPLEEPYLDEACTQVRCSAQEWTLGADEYFVMGDNRNNSQDSRRLGAIPIDHFVGRVVFRYWPISEIGFIQHEDYQSVP